MVTIILELNRELEAQARAAGLLTSEKISAWLEEQVAQERRAAADRLRVTMTQLSAEIRADLPGLTDAEIESEIQQWLTDPDGDAAP